MADPDELNQLSCTRCKKRKVKCNRVAPTCGRCDMQGIECIYPQRTKRRSIKQLGTHGLGTDVALATILDRLQRVEEKCTTLPEREPPRHLSVEHARHHRSNNQSNIASPLSSGTPTGLAGSESPWAPETLNGSPQHSDFDAAAILKSSIDEVQKQALRQVAKSVTSDAVHIPQHLAKSWVAAFFEYKRTELFVSLIDRKLIELIPQLVEMDHVHVDAAIMLVYYTILYHGCAVAASTTSPTDIQYCKVVYVCCLRALPAWQREATGTTTDLIAALSMVMVSADSFDFDLGWQMYMFACQYVQSLNLRNLDAESSSTNELGRISDDDRKGFWELVQLDLYFQLVFGKPAAITATAWKVNMPWLMADSQPQESGVATTVFLGQSRITLVLLQFFSELEVAREGDAGDFMRKTEALCHEIQQLYTEGQLGNWMIGSAENEADIWKVIDVTMTGYTCIVFMLRKAILYESNSSTQLSPGRDLPDSPLALHAARNIIETSVWLLKRYPWPTVVAALFGTFHIDVPYAVLVNAAFSAPDIRIHATDIEMLRRIGERTAEIARAEREYVPLVRALQILDTEFKRRGV